ncbi:MAG: GNAT family N-acetyltransferase [Acidimicrobiia bacterium]
METVRRAAEDDVPALEPLAAALRSELNQERGGRLWELAEADPRDPDSRFAAALNAPDELLVIGCIDEVPVGYAWAVTIPLADGSMRAVIPELYVLPDARKVGLGESILNEIIAWANEQSCVALDAMALPGTRDTKNFFETAGMKSRMLIVSRDLP